MFGSGKSQMGNKSGIRQFEHISYMEAFVIICPMEVDAFYFNSFIESRLVNEQIISLDSDKIHK